MFCTEENRKTCQVEKMGCEGCFYKNDKNKPNKETSDERRENK